MGIIWSEDCENNRRCFLFPFSPQLRKKPTYQRWVGLWFRLFPEVANSKFQLIHLGTKQDNERTDIKEINSAVFVDVCLGQKSLSRQNRDERRNIKKVDIAIEIYVT